MKVKLLKRLRDQARREITIYSITKDRDGTITGMSYGLNDNKYLGLFSFGDTEDVVLKKVEKIFFETNINFIRSKYKKYSRLNKLTPTP